jgi:uncharacterized protein
MGLEVSAITIYPVKSCAGVPVTAAAVEARGLVHDRRWMIVDEHGKFVTGRQEPQLVLLHARPHADGIELAHERASPLSVALPSRTTPRVRVTVWKDTVDALPADDHANAWLTATFGRPLRLVFMDDAAHRPVRPDYASAHDEVSFADGFPLLLIGQASLDHLNQKIGRVLPMARFRPNLVITGADAHAEDGWRRLRVGLVEFELPKLCTRCVFTTIDPLTGTADPTGEPLNTLKTYRRSPDGITFGQNLLPRAFGTVHVGDHVEVLE